MRFGLLIGVLRGSLRSLRCVLHAFRARQWVHRHGLLSAPKNNQSDAQHSDNAAAPAPAPAPTASLRKGIPTQAGFEFPYHSFALLAAFVFLVWKKQLLQGLMMTAE